MPASPVTQQDIENLRNDLRDHEKNDRVDFATIRGEIALIKEGQAGWNSGLKIITWMLGIGFTAVLGLLSAVAAKHL